MPIDARARDSDTPGRHESGAHIVQFYEADAALIDTIGSFVGNGLARGEAALVIATDAHRVGLEARLRERGIDPSRAGKRGRYVALAAAETLATILVDGMPDEARFGAAVRPILESCGGKRIRVFGEMVGLLCADGRTAAAVRLEGLWNELLRKMPFTLLCAYPIGAFPSDAERHAFLEICRAHSDVVPGESYASLTRAGARRRAVASLQQGEIALQHATVDRRRADETRGRLAAIVESSNDAIVSKTLDGIVTSWNRGAERIFGYAAAEMIGTPISRLIPPERRHEFKAILERIRRGERVEHFETERVRKDGHRIYVALTVSPIRDASGTIIGASKVARDVTERKRAEAEREELLRVAEHARAEAEAANRAKDEFLAMLGHELRNPLAAMRNAVVSARLDDARRHRALEIALRQTDTLAQLVDDLLDVSRITQGRIILRREIVDLADVVEAAVEATRDLVADRGHALSVSRPADRIAVEGDPVRLEQVLVNLVTNAAKYTRPGGHIAIALERDHDAAVLRVRDDGTGIAPEMLTRVFDLFVQGERTLDRAAGGLGIGLTVVRSLVALHGGQVEAQSEGPAKGTEFVVRLPVTSAVDEHPATRSRVEQDAARRARVLLVEDNRDAAESLSVLLELLGHHVRVVRDGAAALEVATANVPDVMLVDIGLPGMNGYDVARHVRAHPALERVVLVALTGYGDNEHRRRALEAGFDYHLVKPVDPNDLHGLVGTVGRGTPGSKTPSAMH